MKKKICLALAIIMCLLSFVACGKNNDTQNSTTETTAFTETETNQTTEVETTQTEEIKNNEEKPTGVGEVIEIKEPSKPAATGDFGSSAEFSGIYKITGYMSSTFGSVRQFTLMLEGVDNNSSANYDASKTSIPSYITEGKDHVYLQLIFNDKGLKQWTLIDKYSHTNLGHLSEKELMEHIYPELKYEEVKVGKADSSNEILLSKYPAGKTYVFDLDVSEDGSYSLPKIINDTKNPVIIVSTRLNKNDDEPDKEAKVNKSIPSTALSFSGGTGGKDTKLYMSVTEGSVDYLLNAEDCFYLSNADIGSAIDFSFEDFIYNDTGKTATLECNGTKYILKNGEVIECSWMSDIVLEELS